MSKFVKTLAASNDAIKETRAKMLADTTVLEVESFVQALKKEKLELQNKLANLTDLAPDNSYSLRPGSKDFNAKEWMLELHTTKMLIKLKDMELEVAQDIYNEWFGEEK
jgi:phytoene dehydrogenase-like protein